MSPNAYKTLCELFNTDLDASVMKHLNEGWQLYGNPFTSECPEPVDGSGLIKYLTFHCQVVVK